MLRVRGVRGDDRVDVRVFAVAVEQRIAQVAFVGDRGADGFEIVVARGLGDLAEDEAVVVAGRLRVCHAADHRVEIVGLGLHQRAAEIGGAGALLIFRRVVGGAHGKGDDEIEKDRDEEARRVGLDAEKPEQAAVCEEEAEELRAAQADGEHRGAAVRKILERPHKRNQREEREEKIEQDADHDGGKAAGAERQRAEEIFRERGEETVVAHEKYGDKKLLRDIVRIEKNRSGKQEKHVHPVADLPGYIVEGGREEKVHKERQHIDCAGGDQAGRHPEASV